MRLGRGRRWRERRCWAAVAAAALVAVSAAAGDPAVVVADERGRELAAVPLLPSGRFALRYRHSVYRAEVTETFAASGDGFRLAAVASPARPCSTTTSWEAAAAGDGGWRRLSRTPARACSPASAGHRGQPAHPGGRGSPAALVRAGRCPARLVLSVRRVPGVRRPSLGVLAGFEGAAVDGAARPGAGADGRLAVGGAGLDGLLEADRADADAVAAEAKRTACTCRGGRVREPVLVIRNIRRTWFWLPSTGPSTDTVALKALPRLSARW